MARLPLIGGSYSTRSVIASAQRCINLYPEVNPKFALVQVTHYQRWGLVPKLQIGTGPIRGIFRPSTGIGAYAVSGDQVFQINSDWTTLLLGSITAGRTNPVWMQDNGIQEVLVDGSFNGWSWPVVGGPAVGMQELRSASIVTGGAGWTVGETFQLIGGTYNQTATGVVDSVDGSGAVLTFSLPVPNGIYSVPPANPIVCQTTSGSGGGLTIAGTFGLLGFAQIVDPTGTFTGANRIDYIDTFLLWDQLQQNPTGIRNQFACTESNQVTPFNGLFVAGKTDYPDPLRTLVVNRHEILLFGIFKSETWYDAGNPLFPFAELPGSYIEHGIVAIYSIATQDISTYWLAQNLQGAGMVMRYRGYTTTRISNHAVEFAIQQINLTVGISDAIGYTYQIYGHVFYVLHFPAGNQTWVYDESIGEPEYAWHQEAWTDPKDGSLNRHRGNCAAFINGVNVCGDWENGTIYQMDPDSYTDTVNGNKGPITFIRQFPHIGAGAAPNGQLIEYDGKRMQVAAFIADFEGGGANLVGQPAQQISLRWSNDRGKTWSNPILQSAGEQGEYEEQPVWRDLGIARYPVFELSYSIDGTAALNGAWIVNRVLGT